MIRKGATVEAHQVRSSSPEFRADLIELVIVGQCILELAENRRGR